MTGAASSVSAFDETPFLTESPDHPRFKEVEPFKLLDVEKKMKHRSNAYTNSQIDQTRESLGKTDPKERSISAAENMYGS